MSWRKVLALGGVASVIAIGCTVTVTDNTGDAGDLFGSGGSGTGGAAGSDAGGKGGTAGASTGGKGGAAGSSTGGKAGAGTGGAKDMDASPDVATVCKPDPTLACDNCIETKCCAEWLDCVNDVDCFQTVDGNPPEYECISTCLLNDGGNFPTIDDCAGMCKHDSVSISSATNALIGCMMDTGTGDAANTQNCTNECFLREL
jgi:hypothetical protein